MQNNVQVSVCMTVYNQAEFVSQAIERVLMQKTFFLIELLIGEDCGTKDNSLEICRAYEQKYPNIIRVINDGRNHGMVANEQRLMNNAKGKYIAFCEADDYWVDNLKLQKQVDILEQNPQYSACACQSKVIYHKSKRDSHLYSDLVENNELLLSDILTKAYFQTASFVFRTENIRKMPPLPVGINGWDRAIFLMNAGFGSIYFIGDVMAAYRVNADGISTWVTAKKMVKDLQMLNWLKSGNPDFPVDLYRVFIYYTVITFPPEISKLSMCIYYFLLRLAALKVRKESLDIVKTATYCMKRRLFQNYKKKGLTKLFSN